jgi:hypothetical protein
MADKSIDLGMKYDMPEVAPSKDSAEKVHFPSLYVDSKEDLSQLPDEGTMTVKYCIRSRSKTENEDGAKHSITIDVKSIESFEGDEDDSDNGNTSDDREASLDKMAEEEMESRKSKTEEQE